MNQKIQEIYKKVCGKEWRYDFDPDLAEEFAKLLIDECIKLFPDKLDSTDNRAAEKIKDNFK